MKYFALSLFLFFILSFSINESLAQQGVVISDVVAPDVREGEPVQFEIRFLQASNIAKAVIAYRSFGENEYAENELTVLGNSATFVLEASKVKPPFVEFFVYATLNNGVTEYYPLDYATSSAPLKVLVTGASPKDQEILLLTPEANSKVPSGELFVSVSLLKVPDEVNKQLTRIYLDNYDVTEMAVISDDLVLFSPENFDYKLNPGMHRVSVDLFTEENKLYHSVSYMFELLPAYSPEYGASAFLYGVNVRGESRNETMRGESLWYNNLGIDFNGSYSDWNVDARVYVTSEEKKYLQPNNRYSLTVSSDWLSLGVGDLFPQYPQLIMSGKRVRGFSGNLRAGFFGLTVATGEITRSVDGAYLKDATPSDFASNIVTVDNKRVFADLGTYKRDLLSVRPSFFIGRYFEWGFSFLHGKDDAGSIKYGAKPKENLLLGTDMKFAFDNNRIVLTGQTAVSINNNDISSGTLSDGMIDTLGDKLGFDSEVVKTIKNVFGNFMTVNQYISPFNPQELASLAAEASLSLNYFNNAFKSSYIYRGNDFQSFGQSFIRTDVAGFNISDVLRLMENKIFLSVAYENLSDNLQKTRLSTTTFQTVNTSVAYYPRTDFPNIVFGYSNFSNANTIQKNSADSLYAIDDATNRVSLQLSYSYDFEVKQRTALSFTFTDRTDNTISKNDAENSSVNLNNTSFWTPKLNSTVGISFNNSKTKFSEYSYVSLTLGATYLMLQDKLRMNAVVNPIFGDLKRTQFEISGLYEVIRNLNVGLQGRYFINDQMDNDSIFGLYFTYNFNQQ